MVLSDGRPQPGQARLLPDVGMAGSFTLGRASAGFVASSASIFAALRDCRPTRPLPAIVRGARASGILLPSARSVPLPPQPTMPATQQRVLNKKLSQIFRMRGLQVRPDAMQPLYDVLEGDESTRATL